MIYKLKRYFRTWGKATGQKHNFPRQQRQFPGFSTHKNPGGYAEQNKFSVNAGKT